MFKRILTKVKEKNKPIDEQQKERVRERKEKEFPKQIKVVATPVYKEEQRPTVCFALAINEKLNTDWTKWTNQQIIQYSEIPFSYTMDYAFKKGNNHIILSNNVENIDEGWECELYLDDSLIGKGVVSYKTPLQVDLIVRNNMMVPRKSFRNGFFRTKTLRGLQPNFRIHRK